MIHDVNSVEDVFRISEKTGVYVSVNPAESSEKLTRRTINMVDKLHCLVFSSSKDATNVPEFFCMTERILRKEGSEITDYFGLNSIILAADLTKLRCWQEFGIVFHDKTGVLPPLMVLTLSKKKDNFDSDTTSREFTFVYHHTTIKKYDCNSLTEGIHGDINVMISGLLNAYGYSMHTCENIGEEIEDDDLTDDIIPDYESFRALMDKKYEA
jgi:hypothetical protein